MSTLKANYNPPKLDGVLRLEYWLLLFVAFGMPVRSVLAHEGHTPLPTKGVQVDVERGLLMLSPEAQRSLGLQTSPVELRTLELQALAYTELVTPWQQQHFVSSLVSGRIARVHVTSGEVAQAGQLLTEIASPEVDALRLDLVNAVNDLQLATQHLDRTRELAKSQAVPERELIEAKAKWEQAKSATHVARAKLNSLGIADNALDESLGMGRASQPLWIPIVSPIQGTVSHRDLSIGRVISANEHLFEVHDLTRLWVKSGVLARDLDHVRAGQKVELSLTAYPRESITTRLSSGAVEIDSETQLATVWADIENPLPSLKYLPGMYGTAKIVTSKPEKLLTVPASSLLGSGAERFVLVEVAATAKGQEFRRENVTVLAQSATLVQLRSDHIFPGDRVVKTGGQLLSSFFILGSLRLSKEGMRNVGLRIEPVMRRSVEDVLQFDGVIDLLPENESTLSSQLSGVLARVHVDRGERTKAGQVLAEIEGLALLDTQLALFRANLDATLLDESLTRLGSLAQLVPSPSSLVSTRRLLETEIARNAAVNRRDSARQTLSTMGMSPDEINEVLKSRRVQRTLPIRSPIDGVVVRLEKVLGARIAPDEPLIKIQNLSRPVVRGFLSERDAPKINIGTPVRVRLPSNQSLLYAGRVVRSARSLEGQSRTLTIWIELDGTINTELQQNLVARISATLNQPEMTLAIPIGSIVRELSRTYVFVQKSNGILERRHVELGRADDRFVELRQGLSEGEQIAVQGVNELQTTYATIR